MNGPPNEVLTGRMVGGPFGGIIVEIEAGAQTFRLGSPLVVFETIQKLSTAERERLNQQSEYRFVRVDAAGDGLVAVYEFVGGSDVPAGERRGP